MSREVPLRRSLLLRLLTLAVLVAIGSIAATTWLAVRTTTGAIRQEQGQALADDARVYDTLLGYAATHPNWNDVDGTLRPLARQVGRRIALTTESGTPIADSSPGAGQLPTKPSATVDALSVDTALTAGLTPVGDGDQASARIDPRSTGPYLLPADERTALKAEAAEAIRCLQGRGGSRPPSRTAPAAVHASRPPAPTSPTASSASMPARPCAPPVPPNAGRWPNSTRR
ncbi:hypothetical protein GCM10027614_66200 [Micromonospora vulcania]